jgi:hypothetical protein
MKKSELYPKAAYMSQERSWVLDRGSAGNSRKSGPYQVATPCNGSPPRMYLFRAGSGAGGASSRSDNPSTWWAMRKDFVTANFRESALSEVGIPLSRGPRGAGPAEVGFFSRRAAEAT